MQYDEKGTIVVFDRYANEYEQTTTIGMALGGNVKFNGSFWEKYFAKHLSADSDPHVTLSPKTR